ncbi:restriction endonuclease subunit S [Curtobacterium sp. RRHDQ10]|uniref:restriction endonuclease subunit S n=1 Tax=Curtobacterium phyllosphaerae TaxID=3413379 RepID=UPI003BF3D47B
MSYSIGTIGDLATIEMGQSPKGNTVRRVPIGLPLLNGPTEFGQQHPTPAQWTEAGVRFAHAGDILFCVRGSTTGRMNRADQNYAIGRGIAALRARDGVNSRIVKYALEASLSELLAGVSGSVFPNLSRYQILGHRVPVPPRAERQAIAEVLGALDDKIAANAALAATADKLVRAEYAALKSHVVHVGEVAASPRSGVDPSSVDLDDLSVGLEHMGRRHMWLADGGRAEDVSSTKSRFEPGDILFGKLRPYFHKVVVAPRSGICSTDILVVRSRYEGLSSVLLAALSSDAVIEEVVAASEGTRMPRTSWKDLAAVEIRWPTADAAPQLASRLDSIRGAALAAVAENRTLAATRDALLPQLMSGKLRVRDAEAAASEAGALQGYDELEKDTHDIAE